MKTTRLFSVAVLSALALGCGGGGGGGGGNGNPPPPTNRSVGGLWLGTLDFSDGTSLDTLALVGETGEFQWLVAPATGSTNPEAERQQIFGTLQVSGTSVISMNAISALPTGSVTAAGSTYGFTDLSGTVVERATLAGEFTTTGDQGDVFTGTFAFAYNALYERNSSLATVAGTYTTATDSITIDTLGQLFYQGTDGCVAAGTAEVINADYNMYRLQFEVANCTGATAVRNGLTFDGLAYLRDGNATNDRLEFAVSAATTDDYVIWVLSATK